MTKNASKPRVALIGTAAAVLAAGAIAWVIVDRVDTPASRAPASQATQATGAKPAPKTLDKPLWRDLSDAQRAALAPLQAEWDQMDGMRKRRWLEVSQRFASMTQPEQQRVHERMRHWMTLTPEQRNRARDTYTKARNLAPGEKTASWENYKNLTAEQKRKLARSATRKPSPVALPESPILVVPTSCPPNTTRRGASCITIGEPTAPALAPAPLVATPAPGGAAPAPAAPAVAAPAAAPAGAPAAPPAVQPPAASSPPNASN